MSTLVIFLSRAVSHRGCNPTGDLVKPIRPQADCSPDVSGYIERYNRLRITIRRTRTVHDKSRIIRPARAARVEIIFARGEGEGEGEDTMKILERGCGSLAC